MATNRADTLDPALLRPGRLDRKIEFPLPDRRQKRLVFQARRWQAGMGWLRIGCAVTTWQLKEWLLSGIALPSHAPPTKLQACTSPMNLEG